MTMRSPTFIESLLLYAIVCPPLVAIVASFLWGMVKRWSQVRPQIISRGMASLNALRARQGFVSATTQATTQAEVVTQAGQAGASQSDGRGGTGVILLTPPDEQLSQGTRTGADPWNRAVRSLTIAASGVSLAAAIGLWRVSFWDTSTPQAFAFAFPFHLLLSIRLYVDPLSVYFLLLVNVIALFASWFTGWYLDFDRTGDLLATNGGGERWTFHLFFNLFHTTMLLVCLVDNLILLWIGIQLTTVCSAPLVGHLHKIREAQEAAWKYIVISSAGILFALLGTILLVSALQHSAGGGVVGWSQLYAAVSTTTASRISASRPLVELAFLLIVLGYGTKAGLFPMHSWLPDAHGQAPYPVSALLSGVLLKSALYAILRFFVLTNLALNGPMLHPPNHFASIVLLTAGLLSLVAAVPFILSRREVHFKRVLAYHSLEHMGIITFGFGLGMPIALFGALLHTLNHALTKALMFLTHGTIQSAYDKMLPRGTPVRGVLASMPAAGTILGLGGLALVGSPPFNVFLSEFLILWGGIQATAQVGSPLGRMIYVAAIGLFVLSVTLIFGGLVVHLGRILLGRGSVKMSERFWQTALLALLLLIITWLGFTIIPLTQLINNGVAILCKGAC